jgi:hypothetical protein
MHPEIKKFWEKIGVVDFTSSTPIQYWIVRNPTAKLAWIIIAEVWKGDAKHGATRPTKYYYENISYTESQMLTLVKLKAFL